MRVDLSTFPEGGTGVPGENPRLSAERWPYFCHMRTGFESTLRWNLLGIEVGTLEVKGEWSDHYTTEAPKLHLRSTLIFASLRALPRSAGELDAPVYSSLDSTWSSELLHFVSPVVRHYTYPVTVSIPPAKSLGKFPHRQDCWARISGRNLPAPVRLDRCNYHAACAARR